MRITNDELRITNEEYENFELEAIDVGVQDIIKKDEGITIYSKIEDLQKVKQFLESKNIKVESAEIEFIAKENNGIIKVPSEYRKDLTKEFRVIILLDREKSKKLTKRKFSAPKVKTKGLKS